MVKYYAFSNLELAFRRILFAQNYNYRQFQTTELNAFAWAENENLEQLRREIVNQVYEPDEATKIFEPKISGLLRPFTALSIKDSIIYQALINLIADKCYPKLSEQYYVRVFSNVLPKPRKSQYFFRSWKTGRKRLDEAKKRVFDNGYMWMGKLDLTSFYDLIDHTLLRKVLIKNGIDDEIVNLLLKCLGVWTKYPKGLQHGHGIPQGPVASSLLAECILNNLDTRMTKLVDTVYMRYVDDITVMSTSEKEARKQFARIEILCRQLGLVPAVKIPIRKLSKIEDTIIDEPSQPIDYSSIPVEYPKLDKSSNDKLRSRFLSCFKGQTLKRDDDIVTRIRFTLFRMNKDKRLLNKIFALLITMPCTYDAVNYYLRKFRGEQEVSNRIVEYLEQDPLYDLVKSRCLETLYFIGKRGSFGSLRKHCIKALSSRNNVILRYSGVLLLGHRRNCQTALRTLFDKRQEPYLQQRLLLSIYENQEQTERELFLNQVIRGRDSNLALFAAYLITRDGIGLSRSKRKDVNPWATPTLVRFGILSRQTLGDKILHILGKRFGFRILPGFDCHKVFKRKDYLQALIHLNQAEGAYDTQRAFWLVQIDNFNQLVLYSVFNKKLRMRISYPNVFGSIDSTRLGTSFPTLQRALKACHKLRSSSFITHAYSQEKNAFTTDLGVKQRNAVKHQLRSAYLELMRNI